VGQPRLRGGGLGYFCRDLGLGRDAGVGICYDRREGASLFSWRFIGPFSSYRYECYTFSSFFNLTGTGGVCPFLIHIFLYFFGSTLYLSISLCMGLFYHLMLFFIVLLTATPFSLPFTGFELYLTLRLAVPFLYFVGFGLVYSIYSQNH